MPAPPQPTPLPTALQPTNVALGELAATLRNLAENTDSSLADLVELNKALVDLGGAAREAAPPPEAAENWANLSGTVARGVGEVTQGVALLGIGLNQVNQFFGAISSQIGSMVAKFAPAEFHRFELAVADTQAALGQLLLPLLEKFEFVVKAIGGAVVGLGEGGEALVAGMAAATAGLAAGAAMAVAFSTAVNSATFGISALLGAATAGFVGMSFALKDNETVAQQSQEVIGALAGIIDRLGEGIAPVVLALQPLVDQALVQFADLASVTAEALVDATPAIHLFALAVADVASVAHQATMTLLGLLGYEADRFKPGRAEGMAVRNVRTSSVEAAHTEMLKSAFSIGGGGKPDHMKEMATRLEEAKRLWELIQSDVRDIRNTIAIASPAASVVMNRGQIGADTFAGPVGGIDPAQAAQQMLNRMWLG